MNHGQQHFFQPRKWQLIGIVCSTAIQDSGCP